MERTHEKIVGLWTLTANVKELKQIPELPVNITAYLAGIKPRRVIPQLHGAP